MATNIRREVANRAETVGGEISAFAWILRTAVVAAVAGAIYTELRKPPEERTWHGKVAGVVPYDFRVPNLGDLKRAYWNPHSTRVFTDRPLGVGWAINIPTALRRVGILERRRGKATKASS